MSYLVYCTKHKPVTNGRGGLLESSAHYFKVKWRGVTGSILVNPLGKVILYKKYSALGKLLSANHESERHFIIKAIRETPMIEDGVNWDHEYSWLNGL